MAYTIDKFNGLTVAIIEDGTIDSTLDLKLIGKNYAGYGEAQNENFVWLLENFAGAAAPPRPITGQIWYDSSAKKLKFYDATTTKWKTAGGSEASVSAPANLSEGDFWFDTANKQLYVYDNTQFVLVGPQGISGAGTTQLKSIKVTDNQVPANEHAIVAAYVDGEVMFVVSADPFVLSTASQTLLGGSNAYGEIKAGITLVNTNNSDGITNIGSGRIFWGTVSNAKKLDGKNLSEFVLKGDPFTGLIKFSDLGYTLGDDDDLLVEVDGDNVVFQRQTLDKGLIFKLTDGNQTGNSTQLRFITSAEAFSTGGVGAVLAPSLVGDPAGNTNLGLPGAKFNIVYGNLFKGTADQADKLKVGPDYRSATVDSAGLGTFNSIAVRDAAGRLCAAEFLGNATTATSAGSATNSDNLKVGSGLDYRTANEEISVGTIVARTSVSQVINGITITPGSVKGNFFVGTATSAYFADLAEKYLCDQDYEVGTVVSVGGSAEVTACQAGDRAFGAVSANPAYMMNSGLEGGTYIALKGRVPVKVVGQVRKGDRLMASSNGCAAVAERVMKNMAVKAATFPDTFAIALENSDDEGVKLVESIIL